MVVVVEWNDLQAEGVSRSRLRWLGHLMRMRLEALWWFTGLHRDDTLGKPGICWKDFMSQIAWECPQDDPGGSESHFWCERHHVYSASFASAAV